MTQLLFKAENFISSKANIQISKVDPLFRTLELDSYGHWILGSDSSSLVDKVNSRNLTVQSGATVQPIYSNAAVELSTVIGNSLMSGLSDSSQQDFTLCLVCKCNQNGLTILGGNLPASANTASGSGIFSSSGVGYATVKPTANQASIDGVSSLSAGTSYNQSEYFFIAISVNKASKSATVYVLQNTERFAEKTYTAANYGGLNKIAIGNAFYSGGSGSALFAEAILYDKALSSSQISSVALRSRERMKEKNISI